jgi:hypothetical protein
MAGTKCPKMLRVLLQREGRCEGRPTDPYQLLQIFFIGGLSIQ